MTPSAATPDAGSDAIRRLFDNVPTPIAYIDSDERYRHINLATETWLAKPRDAILGRRMTDVVPPEHHAYIRDCFARARAGEHVFYERKFVWADASVHWARVSFAPDHDAGGHLLGMFVVLTDLTDHKRIEDALAASEKHFRMIMDELPAPVLYVDQNWTYRFVNRQFPKWAGKKREEIEGRPVREVLSPEAVAIVAPHVARALRGEPSSYERSFTWADGSTHRAAVSFMPDVDDTGRVAGTFAVMHDVTDIRAAEAALAASEKHFRMLIDELPAPVVYVDEHWTYRFVNRQFPQWMGKPREAIEGRPVRDVVPPESFAFIEPYMARALRGEQSSYERAFVWADGSQHPAIVTFVPHVDDSGNVPGIFAVLHDLTELRRAEAQLRLQATRDGLTGLANRNLFMDRLLIAVAKARRSHGLLALLFIDLDGFKQVNDSLGHAAGDQLLVEVARRFAACLRESDTLARLGGDEFTIILDPVRAPENADTVAAKLLEALTAPIRLGSADAQVSASVGISLFPFDGVDAEALMKQADAAMYQAKHAGKGRHVHASSLPKREPAKPV
jgi:diguanylate cyclase (GGDEF)-like protein/PAS domain S-box-containing protein